MTFCIYSIKAYPFFSVATMVMLLLIPILSGCHHSYDPRLAKVDAIMEEHPDSALHLLNEYHLTSSSSPSDSAYYGLLLTHTRYKNFIDETDDSLISRSVERFLRVGDKERASRALFLQGMIFFNAQRFSEAAVLFAKGFDMAHEAESYMWEGQCAMGLCMIYGKLHDASAQVDYARRSYDAFKKTLDDDWINYSIYALALAYNNNGKCEKSLSVIDELFDHGAFLNDSTLLSELYTLKGITLSALGRYEESLNAYSKARLIKSSVLSVGDRQNIQVALSELKAKGDTCISYPFLEDLDIDGSPQDAFAVYVKEGRYKEAYERLERYKNLQDSVLSFISRNNVSESVNHYKELRDTLLRERVQKWKMYILLILLIVMVVGIIIVFRVRERIHKEESERLKTEADIESLRSDLLSQLDAAKMALAKASESTVRRKTADFENIIRQRYSEANRLCDDYYQKEALLRGKEKAINEEIREIVSSFTDEEELDKIAEYIDEQSGGLYSSFRKDFYFLPGETHRLFLYLMMGLSSRTLSVIFGQDVSAVYNKKSRLKSKIGQSEVDAKADYLRFF